MVLPIPVTKRNVDGGVEIQAAGAASKDPSEPAT
jgi:hypothetical protein